MAYMLDHSSGLSGRKTNFKSRKINLKPGHVNVSHALALDQTLHGTSTVLPTSYQRPSVLFGNLSVHAIFGLHHTINNPTIALGSHDAIGDLV